MAWCGREAHHPSKTQDIAMKHSSPLSYLCILNVKTLPQTKYSGRRGCWEVLHFENGVPSWPRESACLVCRCCSKQAPSWGHCWFFQLLEEHPCLIALTKWLHNVASLPGQIGRLRRKHVQPFGARNNIIQNDPNKNCLSNHHLTIIQPPIVSILSIISMWYDVGTTIINHPPVITIFFSVVCLRANPSVCPRRRRQHVRTSKSTVFCGTKCTCPWSWLSSCKAQLSYLCVECYNNITINIIIIITIIIIIIIITIIIIIIIMM